MVVLTNREKASRYDALQAAIRHTVEMYKKRLKNTEKQYKEAVEVGVLGAYSKGLADAYASIVGDLERWTGT